RGLDGAAEIAQEADDGAELPLAPAGDRVGLQQALERRARPGHLRAAPDADKELLDLALRLLASEREVGARIGPAAEVEVQRRPHRPRSPDGPGAVDEVVRVADHVSGPSLDEDGHRREAPWGKAVARGRDREAAVLARRLVEVDPGGDDRREQVVVAEVDVPADLGVGGVPAAVLHL